jgi:glycosyltransferase involved in cell wall biosynthesis
MKTRRHRSPIRVCFFPGRESSYTRSRVLLNGLREAGLIVHDCSSSKRGFLRYFSAFGKFLKFERDSDVIFVGFFGHVLVPIVRLWTRRKIIFDTYLSAYQTLAFDRKVISPKGVRAAVIRFVEKLSCRLADACLLDTEQHIEYFVREYHLDRGKFHRSFVGAEYPEAVSSTYQTPDDPIIHFHGEFQALHGVKFIVEAAKLLPQIKFRMIGSGRELDTCVNYCKALKADNVHFIPWVPFETLQQYIKEATVCLGIFGETQKTQLVIPIKVYEALAAGKPIITSDTPAIRELLTDGKDVFLCNTGDSDHLAWAIRTLLADDDLRNSIAANGHQTYLQKCTPEKIGRDIANLCGELLRH